MSFFSFTKNNKESYSLVFNIGSGSVSGGIIRFTEKEGVDVLTYAKELIPFQQEISIPKHVKLMKTVLLDLAHKIQTGVISNLHLKKGKKLNIDRVFYMFSSPWSISQTKTIRIKESKLFKVTDSYINKIISDQEKAFQISVSKSGRIIERKIIQVKINGYEVNDYSDKLTRDLEISVFFTAVGEDILQLIDETVSNVFQVKNVWCHSLSLSAFSIIRNLFPHLEDYIYLEGSEEVTDISIVKNNIIVSEATIPMGRNHFIRSLSQKLNVTEEIADSMLKMQSNKNHDELAAIKLSVAMDGAAKDWLLKIQGVFETIKEKIFIPETIFLITNNELTPFLKDKMQKQDFTVMVIDNKKIKTSLPIDDIILKLELMFLDNLYKI